MPRDPNEREQQREDSAFVLEAEETPARALNQKLTARVLESCHQAGYSEGYSDAARMFLTFSLVVAIFAITYMRLIREPK